MSELMERHWRSMRGMLHAARHGGEGSRLFESDGVTAAITPATPDASVPNSAVAESAEALGAALDELASAYDSAGVRAWTVWIDAADRASADVLSGAGHLLDGTPTAMGLRLDELVAPSAPEPEWSGEWDMPALGRIMELAYGRPTGSLAPAWATLPAGTGHQYTAHVDGEPGSVVLVHDVGDDCMFWIAATIPAARGRGLVSGMLHRALIDARERGCLTSTTQATAMGRPVYARLGYKPLGALEMWERRAMS